MHPCSGGNGLFTLEEWDQPLYYRSCLREAVSDYETATAAADFAIPW